MHKSLAWIIQDVRPQGDARGDMERILARHGLRRTAEHALAVAAEARRIAERFALSEDALELAGWLHDISALWPAERRLEAARSLRVATLPEEEAAPMLLHQKLSAVVAREVFGVRDNAVLSAIACHTTLRARAAPEDKALFIADKIAWDQPGTPPYLPGVLAGLKQSLDRAALAYLDFLWQRRATLAAIHPWFFAAHAELSAAAK